MNNHPVEWLYYHRTNFLLMEWENFIVHMCNDCWGNDCNLPWFLKWYAIPYHKRVRELIHFHSTVIFMNSYNSHNIMGSSPYFICFIWMIPGNTELTDAVSWLITEYHFHPITLFNLDFFCLSISVSFHLVFSPVCYGSWIYWLYLCWGARPSLQQESWIWH